ncbi:MAG: 16S rRNA (uracil(1498)-N(3))-methyltransferase [Flavobacteriaceae bacterium]|nr:16S rRNA (uracil(1498)-N(3))-methyltransferase [Flavobacteriaceae bacterium]
MQRFYTSGVLKKNDFLLEESESHHALKVLRHKAGDVLQVVDGLGHLFQCELIGEETKQCRLRVMETFFTKKTSPEIHIAVAPTKQIERMEWMTEKLTELGIAGIHFIITERTERPRLKMERLKKTAISAMKQCQRLWLPEIEEAMPFLKFIEQAKTDRKMIAHCSSTKAGDNEGMISHIPASFSLHTAHILLLIGPEGDFTKQEIDLALANSFTPVSLGQNILRTETAATAAAALLCIR